MTVTKAGHGDQPQRAAAAAAETSALLNQTSRIAAQPAVALPGPVDTAHWHPCRAQASGFAAGGSRSGDNFTARALGTSQDLDSKVAEPKCGCLPAILGEGGPGDPVDDWTHKRPCARR